MSELWKTVVTFLLGAGIIATTHPKTTTFGQVDLRLIPPPEQITKFTFGYSETVADILWLRLVQDFHVCEKVKDGVAHVDGVTREAPACRKGWVFKMADVITELAPKWKQPHSISALLLSIVVDDMDGAKVMFDKGIARFPYDYNLLYNGAYHYLWEIKDEKRAAELLIRAAKNGGSPWMYSLAGKLYSKSGQAELAKSVLEDALKTNPNEESEKRIRTRLKEVNAIIERERRTERR